MDNLVIPLFIIWLMKKIKLIRVRVDLANPNTFPKGFINKDALDATTDAEVELHKKEDDDQAKLDALNKNTQQS
ncbi:hypothetical protein AOC28_09865 [Polynucleobacter sp. MWH-Adler-W8]|nr:hypothetical protein AOC28_09865 [Polynucleobacter sp. MWH-Adler-W8]